MIKAIRSAGKPLGEGRKLVCECLRRRQTADGGFRGRSDSSDLYYSVFGYEALRELNGSTTEGFESYLRQFNEQIEKLDFNHLCSLIRNWANLREEIPAEIADRLKSRLEMFRSKDNGFHHEPGQPYGTAYGAFLALAAQQELDRTQTNLPWMNLLESVKALQGEDGGFSNERREQQSMTPATAAAAVVLHELDEPVAGKTREWLLNRRFAQGGFLVGPAIPMPDLLSTATAVHALRLLDERLDDFREPCLDYLETLWSPAGGFRGQWLEEVVDTEYTYYGLLTLGHLHD